MEKLYSFLWINFGVFLVAFGIVAFKIPNDFATGGVTGIAIILNKAAPFFTVGMLIFVFNVALLIIGMLFIGFEFQIKTIYSTIMLSLLVWLMEKYFPIPKPLTGDTLLELFIASILLAVGSAILFYQNASSGGTDIIAKIINQVTYWNIGRTVLIVDFVITIFALWIFGLKIGMYSILGVIINGFLIDAVIEGLHSSKQIIVISDKSDEIKKYIINILQRGVTVYNAIGGNTNEAKHVLNTIISYREAVNLRQYILKIDKDAFVIVDNVSEIYGKGFKSVHF